MKDLAARARDKKLKPGDYQGGASAISNLGMHGVREFTAIINPPHATILAVGAARRQAVEKDDGGIAFVSMMTVTLSCDHRVLDGALGAPENHQRRMRLAARQRRALVSLAIFVIFVSPLRS